MTLPAPGDPVLVRYLKWRETPHWRHEMEVFTIDDHGVWLGARPGHRVTKAEEPWRAVGTPFVQLVPRDAWWTAIFHPPQPRSVAIYVDIITPPQWHEDEVRMIDLDLDVVRERDGSVRVLDEDEFVEHRRRFGYPPHVVDQARATTARIVLELGSRAEPFGAVGDARLDRWMDATRQDVADAD